MASLIPGEEVRESVLRRLEFDPPMGGKRQRLHLGRMSGRDAGDFKRRVEQIVHDLKFGNPHTGSMGDWLTHLPLNFQLKFERKGLMKSNRKVLKTIGDFLVEIFENFSVKPSTMDNYCQARRNLLEFFGPAKQLRSIEPQECQAFRRYLENLKRRDGEPRLAKATIGRRIKLARQFLKEAVRQKIVTENPFADVKGGGQRNTSRLVFVKAEWIDKVLASELSIDWQVLIVLGRYGGLRIPSEIRKLEWAHVDFALERMLVHAPKTEHHEGKATRWVPLFDEIKNVLLRARELADPESQFVISDRKLRNAPNLRTGLIRIIERAGVEPWVKPWQNMRSTRETELVERLKLKGACAIIGNSEKVALEHYLQLRPEYLENAIEEDRAGKLAEQNPACKPQETSEIERKLLESLFKAPDVSAAICRYLQNASNSFQNKDL